MMSLRPPVAKSKATNVVLPKAMPLPLIAVWYAAAESLICSPRSQLDLRKACCLQPRAPRRECAFRRHRAIMDESVVL